METNDLSKILDHINKLYAEKEALAVKLVESKQRPETPYRSAEIKDLAAALAKAQAEMTTAALNRQNPFFKSRYADLMSVVNASRPSLAKNGLSVLQDIITYEEGQTVLHTILLHTSGQYIESRMRIVPPKNDVQSMSSYTTYLKRLSYSSLIGVVTGDEDDDGEVAMVEARNQGAKGVSLNTHYNPKEQTYETVSKDQLEQLEYELAEFPDITEQILDGLKIHSLADMPKSKFNRSIERIREITLARKGAR